MADLFNFRNVNATAMIVFIIASINMLTIHAQSIGFTNVASDMSLEYSFNAPSDFGMGIGLFDFNNDGLDDLFFGGLEDEPLHFYMNKDSIFELIEFTGIDNSGNLSKCLMWIDFDNDNDLDLSLTNIDGPSKLFQNDGDFNFTDVSEASGIGNIDLNAYSGAWADYNKDGYIDLYIGNREISQFGSKNRLFKNNGDGTFEDVTNLAGVFDGQGYAYAVTFLDYDKDGWPDIFIANDKSVSSNTLFRNLGDGQFEDVSDPLTTGIHMDGMGIALGDFDRNGFEDIYVTNTAESSVDFGGNIFLQNHGNGTFTEIAGAQNMRVYATSWGTLMADFNNNALLDIFVSNENPVLTTNRNSLFINQGDESFIQDTLNDLFITYKKSWGCAVGDINNDGYYDIAVMNSHNDLVSIWKNKGDDDNNWIKVQLEGTESNKDALGSWIETYFNDQKQVTYTRSSSSYGSQSSNSYIIGLGNANLVDSLIIKWPNGLVNKYYNLEVNQPYHFIEHLEEAVDTTQVIDTMQMDTTDISTSIYANYIKQFDFKIYPNPIKDVFSIEVQTFKGSFEILILDTDGKKILHHYFISSEELKNFTFNLSKQLKGKYYVTFLHKNFEITRQCVKQ